MLDSRSLQKVVGQVGRVGRIQQRQGFYAAPHAKNLVGRCGAGIHPRHKLPHLPHTRKIMWGRLKTFNHKASPHCPTAPHTKIHQTRLHSEERP
jgi:hypothetical protein